MTSYVGYLTEEKLGTLLSKLGLKPKAQFSFSGSRHRYDYYCRSINTLVEFDGFQHYTKTKVVRADLAKEHLAKANGVYLIRIPYFVQLKPETCSHWKLPAVDSTYPHGFVSTASTCVLPEDFCLLGHRRFLQELASLPSSVTKAILSTSKLEQLR